MEQIDAYFSDLDTDQGPVTSEQVADLLGSVREVPVALVPIARKPRVWVAVAAFAVVAVLVGLVAWLAPSGTSAPSVDEPTVTSAAPNVLEVTWERSQWAIGEGPDVGDVVAASGFLLGTDRIGHLWRSSDGVNWERVFGELTGISVAGDESLILIAGRTSDGTSTLLRSDDGSNWTQVDHSNLGLGERFTVVKTTPSGLTWFHDTARRGSASGVLAAVSGDRVTEVHDPPWDHEACCGADLIEVGGTIVAYQDDWNEPRFSRAWTYLGNGEWSEAIDVTFTSDHAVVGETALMFDQTNATCCARPIRGTSLWPLLASSDGINWIEVAQIPGDNVHTLHVNAGSSFWIYGPSIGGGGTSIEVGPDTTLGISRDGVTWQRVDISQVDVQFMAAPRTGFIHVVGNTIFLFNETAFEGIGEYWVGTVSTLRPEGSDA